MFRFLTFMLGLNYEECKSCETLKQQLSFANEEKKQLTQTIIDIVKPRPIAPQGIVSGTTVPITAVSSFSRRRAAREARDREEAKALRDSPFIAKPDDINDKIVDNAVEKLEKELHLSDELQETNEVEQEKI